MLSQGVQRAAGKLRKSRPVGDGKQGAASGDGEADESYAAVERGARGPAERGAETPGRSLVLGADEESTDVLIRRA